MREIRKKAFLIVEPTSSYRDPHFAFDVFIIILIIVNVLALIFESVPEYLEKYETEAFIFEVFSVVVFSLEYLLRIWTTVEKPGFEHPIKGRIKWMIRPIALVDLLAILPFYLPFIGVDLIFLRVFRTRRIIRIFNIARSTNAFDTI